MSKNNLGTPESMGLAPQVFDAYLESLLDHIAYVQEAGKGLGVPAEQLEVHDASKFTPIEFSGYARHFYGGGDPDAFVAAWHHHLHHNPHHWQHWLFPDGLTPAGSQVVNGAIFMPDNFALEMVADWMGANRAYQKNWDMTKWLINNLPKIKLHPDTQKFVTRILWELEYKDVLGQVGWLNA